MAISQGLTTLFKKNLLEADINFSTATIKMALVKSTANIGPETTSYSELGSEEVSGTNYISGGNVLSATVATSGTTAYVDFADSSWSTATFTAAGALIYNGASPFDAIAVLDFGGDKTVTAGTFIVKFPTAGDSAIIRIE